MTFRRRLLIATVTLGGGILCIQPVMRSRLESRLSEIMRAKVEIGSSKLSLVDGTIALRDVVVHSALNDSPTSSDSVVSRIPHVALKFDWNSLLYRNLKVNNIVASDVHWLVSEPTSEFIPFAVETASLTSGPSPTQDSTRLATVIEPILREMKQTIANVSDRQSQTQRNVSSRIRDILSQLAEAMPSDGSLNVLRQQDVVDNTIKQLPKQLAPINQLIAEDRIAYNNSEKILTAMYQAAPGKLKSDLGNVAISSTDKLTEDAVQIAKLAVAKEWNRNRSILQLAIQSITALRDTPALTSLSDGELQTQANSSNFDFIPKLPVGLTRLLAGKVKGSIQFSGTPADSPESNSDFELQFKNLSNRGMSNSEQPGVAIRMTRDSQSASRAWMTCTIQETESVQSDATQFQVVFQRVLDGNNSCVSTVQHANQGWSATISIPIGTCIEISTSDLKVASPNSSIEKHIIGKLIGTTSAVSADQNEILIEIEPSSIEAISAILKPNYDLEAQRKRDQAEIRGKEQLKFELEKIDVRWEQLKVEHTLAHESWDSSLKDVNIQVEKLRSAFKRTARTAAGDTSRQ